MQEQLEPDDPRQLPADILGRIDVPESLRAAGRDGPHSTARRLLQEYRPISESIEWALSSLYWETEGIRPFVRGEVPHVVNNSGWAAAAAATVLFAGCEESAPGRAPIAVLELGAGLGLFAVQVLEEFRRLCAESARDYYDRLTYYVTDRSATMVRAWKASGQFEAHAERVVLARCDAMRPGVMTTLDGREISTPSLLAVFANYVLDSLPLDIVRRRGGEVERLCVRTYVSAPRPVLNPAAAPDADVPLDPNADPDPDDLANLLPDLPHLEFESAFRPLDGATLPYLSERLECCPEPRRVTLNHGALHCIAACLERLAPGGFLLVNDFGATQPESAEALSVVHRFGGTVAAGIDFPFLEHCLRAAGRPVLVPDGDADQSIHSRLVAAAPLGHTARVFLERYGGADHRQADRISNRAIEQLAAGRCEEAFESYRSALAYSPNDWHLLGQASQFLSQQLRRNEEARQLALRGLAINPWHSPQLWNALGNSLYALDQRAEAHQAYLKAQAIDGDDPQTNLNLAFTFADFGDLGAALAAIARGLEHDDTGRFESHLLARQQQILALLAQRRHDLEQRAQRRLDVLAAADGAAPTPGPARAAGPRGVLREGPVPAQQS